VILAVSCYHFQLDFLLDLDVFSFDRLVDRARDVRNAELREQAIAMRVAFNGDSKQFEQFFDSLAPAGERAAAEAKKVAQGFQKLKGLFGG
jgi:hypothetical protein